MYVARFPKLHDIRAGAVVKGGLTVIGSTRIAESGEAWHEVAPETKGAMPSRSGGTHLTSGNARPTGIGESFATWLSGARQ
ncbi:MAG TPA: hypothetical protein VLI43_08950 [Gemmatimonadaceae bacterium]|nr:hypothetical protein [Gemmatimonadaceae bacterium]